MVVADNTISSQIRAKPTSSYDYFSHDETDDEVIQAVVLALDIFTAERFDQGPTSGQKCDRTNTGRGCLRLTGGIIQNTRGAAGQVDGHGYVKRYSYDACAASNSPPYFPTTGHFVRDRFFEAASLDAAGALHPAPSESAVS